MAGSGTALGARLNEFVAAGRLTQVQATQLLTEAKKLTAGDGATYDYFGSAVSVSTDGSTALVGAYGDDDGGSSSGSAYLFDLTQSSPTPTKLTASDAAAWDYFGWAVSLNSDGSTALIGAYGDNTFTGAAYLFDLTLAATDAGYETKLTASDGAANEHFGDLVSLSADGTTALVAAPADAPGGSAYVFDLTQSPPTETKLTASDADLYDGFGGSVSVNGDGTSALIGADGNDDDGTDSGSAYVFDLTQSPPTETKLTASDAAEGDNFGHSVSVSGDGTTALVGADSFDGNTGAVYVFDLSLSDTDSGYEMKITASDADYDQEFGYSVSLSADGSTALVGSFEDNNYTGSAYVFDLTQSPPTETKLTASDGAADDEFGYAVSINDDGTTALIGADYADSYNGAAYVFRVEGFTEPITLKNGMEVTPGDLDGDGLYEDLNGDGAVTGIDLGLLSLLENEYRKGSIELTDAQIAGLDFNEDGEFTKFDVIAFARMYDLKKEKP